MLRENSGFETTADELHAMRAAAVQLAGMRIDGVVAGFATGGELRLDELLVLIDAAPRLPVTFHRAFDSLANPLDAIDILSGIPQIDGILTSGGEGPAEARCAALREYVARAAPAVAIIAGGGVDLEAFRLFVQDRSVTHIHVGRAARDGQNPEGPVSAASVRRLRDLADSPVGF
jgi:copper homeostasis protein